VVALLAVGILLSRQWQDLSQLRSEIESYPWRISWGWLLASLVLATLNLFLMAVVWVDLFRARGGQVDRVTGTRIWLVTNLGRYIPGKVWQFVGMAAYMKERSGQGARALGATITFQLLSLLTGLAVAVTVLGTRAIELPGGSPVRLALLVLILVVLLHPAVMRTLVRLAARLLSEDADPGTPRLADDVRAAGGLLIAWAVYGLGFWCLARGTMSGPLPGPVVLAGVFAAGYVVGYMALIAPGGIVIREGAIAGLLAALTPLPLGVTAALAAMTRIWIVLSELIAVSVAASRTGGRSGGAGGERETVAEGRRQASGESGNART
jgi:uncharacterized membrane protein YbhN (UPF0104 family)